MQYAKERVSRRYFEDERKLEEVLSSSKSSDGVSFSQSQIAIRIQQARSLTYSREFTQSRLQLLGFAFINGNVYGAIPTYRNSVLGV
jgi:hypothetical protein